MSLKKENKKSEILEEDTATQKKLKLDLKEVGTKTRKHTFGLLKEFKKFISKGNVIDMATGVVIGGAFGAIVTTLTNIFLSICTWAVPGGLKGLITVLPAANELQAGIDGIGQTFAASNLHSIAVAIANYKYKPSEITAQLIETIQTNLTSKYTLYGSTYVYNGAAIINWGAFINAVISFLVIAAVLFIIIKVFKALNNARMAAQTKAMEEFYKKYPEARPNKDPSVPEPKEIDVLKEILAALKTQDKSKSLKNNKIKKSIKKK